MRDDSTTSKGGDSISREEHTYKEKEDGQNIIVELEYRRYGEDRIEYIIDQIEEALDASDEKSSIRRARRVD